MDSGAAAGAKSGAAAGAGVAGDAAQDLALGATLAGATLLPNATTAGGPGPGDAIGDESRVSVAVPSAMHGPLPSRIGRYLILRRLGEGGMGVVFAAYDPQLDRKVAIKLLRPAHGGSMGQARMQREAQAMAQVSHSHIVQVYEVGHDEKPGSHGLFVAMEFVDGQPLSQWQKRQRAGRSHLGPDEVRDVLQKYIQAGRGLQAAHQAGLVHRDFKPDNVLVGNDGRVRVADFGLARSAQSAQSAASGAAQTSAGDSSPAQAANSSSVAVALAATLSAPASASTSASASVSAVGNRLTQVGSILGTPGYMSPEQVRGQEADARSDQFSFCAALHEALYGVLPFAGDTFEDFVLSVLSNRKSPLPTDVHEIPVAVMQAIERGLALDAADRFPAMDALLAQLEAGLATEPETPRSRRNTLIVVSLIGSVFAVIISFVSLFDLSKSDESMATLVCVIGSASVPVAVLGWLIHTRFRVHGIFRRLYFMLMVMCGYLLMTRVSAFHAGVPRSLHLRHEIWGLLAIGCMACRFVTPRLLAVFVPLLVMAVLMQLQPAAVMQLAAASFGWLSMGSLYIAFTEQRTKLAAAARGASTSSASQVGVRPTPEAD